MKGRASWALYGALALAWVGFFGWRTYQTAASNAQLSQTDAASSTVKQGQSSRNSAEGVRPAYDAEKLAAWRCIKGQLEAFKKDDYATAVKFQSSSLRSMFPNTTQFRNMIRSNYPQFAHYKSLALGHAICDKDGSHLSIAASLNGADGKHVDAIYDLVREDDSYHVAGVSGGGVQQPRSGAPTVDPNAIRA